MNNVRVAESASEIRRVARAYLKGKWGRAMQTVLVYEILMVCAPTILLLLPAFMGDVPEYMGSSLYDMGGSVDAWMEWMNKMTVPMFGFGLFTMIITGPLRLGLSVFALTAVRGGEIRADMPLSGFNNAGKAIGLYLLSSIFVWLWNWLFIIPGIIAFFAYSQIFFLLADNPGIGVYEAIRTSRRMMAGNKFKIFCLFFSFIGWGILTGLVAVVVGGILAWIVTLSTTTYAASYVATNIVTIIVYALVMVPLQTYLTAATAVFYELASGNRRPGSIEGRFTVVEEATGAGVNASGESGFGGSDASTGSTGSASAYADAPPASDTPDASASARPTREASTEAATGDGRTDDDRDDDAETDDAEARDGDDGEWR